MIGKPVRDSDHLEARLVIRHIGRELPERIIREAERSFTDTATGYRIAVATVAYRGAHHLLMVAVEDTASEIVAVSLHPLDERDVERKISNGRWIT
jgi:nitrogenase molybdenum-iron protein alpha/beta subunit